MSTKESQVVKKTCWKKKSFCWEIEGFKDYFKQTYWRKQGSAHTVTSPLFKLDNNSNIFVVVTNNYDASRTRQHNYHSSNFSPATKFHAEFYLTTNRAARDSTNIFASLAAPQSEQANCEFRLEGVINLLVLKSNGRQTVTHVFEQQMAAGQQCFIGKKLLLDFDDAYPEGTERNNLTVEFSVKLFDTECVEEETPEMKTLKKKIRAKMSSAATRNNHNSQFAAFFDNEKLSDVTVTVGADKIRAHKFLLTARSPVFAAMFEHDVRENSENNVVVTDIEPEVMRELLRFMYTGEIAVESLRPMASEFLIAADKYQLDSTTYEQQYAGLLDAENALQLFILADRYDLGLLKDEALSFIKANSAEILHTERVKTGMNGLSEVFSVILDALEL